LNDCTDRQNQTSNRCLKLTARWLSHIQYIKNTKMYLLYRIYGPHTTKIVVYASIVTTLHEIIDLKHRSPWIRLYPLIMWPISEYRHSIFEFILTAICISTLLYVRPFRNIPYCIINNDINIFLWSNIFFLK